MDNEKDNLMTKLKQIFSTVRYCFGLSWRSSPLYTIIRMMIKIVQPLISIFITFCSKYILDAMAGSYKVGNILVFIGLLITASVAAEIVYMIFTRIEELAESLHNEIMQKDISMKMMNRGIKADMEFFDNPEYYDKFEAVRMDMHSVLNVMWSAINCISFFISFMIIFLIVCRQNLLFAFILLAVSVPSSIINKLFTKQLYLLSLDQINEQRKQGYLYSLATLRQYTSDIRMFKNGERIKMQYETIWKNLFKERKKASKKKTVLVAFSDALPYIVKLIILLSITVRVMDGTSTLGDYSLYSGLIAQLTGSITIMFLGLIQIYDDKLRIDNVKSFDKMKDKIASQGDLQLKEVETIQFDHVSFAYPGTETNVLDNVSFEIDKGENVALVGINGAGKSTIIKLLLRFYDVNGGRILINGKDIKEYNIESLRDVFSSCFQDSNVYGFTIRENVIMGNYEKYNKKEDTEVYQAMKDSEASEIIEDAPKGLETYLTRIFDDEGIVLSGGQNQKLALARTFYRDSPMVILDEPSSSLDPEAENKIFETIRKLSKKKTTLFTSHRLSNVSIADKIIVIENGKIIEIGTHAELIAGEKRYAVLFKYQSDKYIDLQEQKGSSVGHGEVR